MTEFMGQDYSIISIIANRTAEGENTKNKDLTPVPSPEYQHRGSKPAPHFLQNDLGPSFSSIFSGFAKYTDLTVYTHCGKPAALYHFTDLLAIDPQDLGSFVNGEKLWQFNPIVYHPATSDSIIDRKSRKVKWCSGTPTSPPP
jgi:hypothetical protein